VSKTQQRVATQYDMGYADGLRGKTVADTNRNNQYNIGYRRGLANRKVK